MGEKFIYPQSWRFWSTFSLHREFKTLTVQTIPISALKHTIPASRYGQHLTYSQSHIARAVAAIDSSAWQIGPRREVSLAIIYSAVFYWGAIPCWCVLMRTKQLFNLAATSRVICVRYWLYRGIGSREFKIHVCAKRQTWICATWPSFPLNCRLLFITSTRKDDSSVCVSACVLKLVLKQFKA